MTNWNRPDLSHEALKAWQTAHPELDPDRGKPRRTPIINHDYDIQGDSKPMTTPTAPLTPAQQAENFREEIRAAFDLLLVEIAEIRAELATMREGLTHASQPAPASATFGEMEIAAILKSIDKKNKINYTATGAPYSKWGVRVWDEVLPALGIDPAALEFGNNEIMPAIRARVLLGETTNRETGIKGIGPHKVTGKA